MQAENQTESDDHGNILLLEPNHSNSSKKKQDPSASFIGGHPTYYTKDVNYSTLIKDQICGICGNRLYLLLQMYAPLDDLERTMYVFACNNSSCIQQAFETSASSGDGTSVEKFSLGDRRVVRCIRSQYDSNDAGETNDAGIAEKKNATIPTSTWDNNKNTDDGGWGDDTGTNGWGIGSDSIKDDTSIKSIDELEAMLSAMEAKLGNSEDVWNSNSTNKKTRKKDDINKVNDPISSIPAFKRFELDIYDEPSNSNRESKNIDLDDDDLVGMACTDNSKIQKMLTDYLKEEDDETIKAIIFNGNGGDNNHGRGASGGDNGEKYERLPPEDRAFLAFTDRIKRAPFQVVRYAYDGVAMWSIPLPLTKKGKKGGRCRDTKFPTIPTCTCGAQRKFECQLMPSLLNVLDVDKYSYIDTHNNSSKLTIEQVLSKNEGGMNWGVLAVYSCSDSCNQSIEEFVIIQDSVDVIPKKMALNRAPDMNDDDGQ